MLGRTSRSIRSSSPSRGHRPLTRSIDFARDQRPPPISPFGASTLTRPEAHPYPYPPELEIVRVKQADGLTLAVRGEVDLASAPALERELRDAETSARRIVVDLAGLEFMDSTGIHALMDAHARAKSNGHKLVLTHLPAQVQRLFNLTGIDVRLTIE